MSDLTPKYPINSSQGLSFIELLVTLAVIGILLTIGLPSFNRMLDKNRVESATYDLIAAIQTTRNLAVAKHQRAVLKAKGEWHHGWELFIDTNDNGLRDAGEQLLTVQDSLDVVITASTQNMKTISFIGSGESRQAKGSAGGSFLAGSLMICGKNQLTGYKLILARGGRTRLAKAAC